MQGVLRSLVKAAGIEVTGSMTFEEFCERLQPKTESKSQGEREGQGGKEGQGAREGREGPKVEEESVQVKAEAGAHVKQERAAGADGLNVEQGAGGQAEDEAKREGASSKDEGGRRGEGDAEAGGDRRGSDAGGADVSPRGKPGGEAAAQGDVAGIPEDFK